MLNNLIHKASPILFLVSQIFSASKSLSGAKRTKKEHFKIPTMFTLKEVGC